MDSLAIVHSRSSSPSFTKEDVIQRHIFAIVFNVAFIKQHCHHTVTVLLCGASNSSLLLYKCIFGGSVLQENLDT